MLVNYYQIVPSKMEKTNVIIENPLIKPFVPKTQYLSLNNLRWMLSLFPMVVFKPDIGAGGKKIGLIRKTNEENKYTIHYRRSFHKNMSIEDILEFIKELAPDRKFILQKGIDLIKINNNPMDVRISIQKPNEHWEITGVIAKIAAKNKMVTNRHSGGKGAGLRDVLKNASYCREERKKLNITMLALAYQVADTLNEVYPGLRELGLDIGIDNNLWPWILEVNTKPQYGVFGQIKDKSMYEKIDKYNKLIHSSVEYYLRSNQAIKNNNKPRSG